MKKDAYYFPHYCNARHDRKLKRVQKDLGIEGYGIYFMLLEVLREQVNFKYPLSDIDLLADEFNCSEVKIKGIITQYELFNTDLEQNFFSVKQIQYLQPYIEKSKRASDAARIRWDNANASANALQMLSDGNASKGEESKVKKSKVKVTDKKMSEQMFDSFWNLYDKKEDNKKCKDLFEKLPEQTQQKILQVVPLYVSKTPDKKFRKHPLTWLRGNCWDDDYSDATQQVQKKKPEPKYFHNQEDYESALAEWNAKNPTSNLHDIQGHLL